jgi:hypothetical protein
VHLSMRTLVDLGLACDTDARYQSLLPAATCGNIGNENYGSQDQLPERRMISKRGRKAMDAYGLGGELPSRETIERISIRAQPYRTAVDLLSCVRPWWARMIAKLPLALAASCQFTRRAVGGHWDCLYLEGYRRNGEWGRWYMTSPKWLRTHECIRLRETSFDRHSVYRCLCEQWP